MDHKGDTFWGWHLWWLGLSLVSIVLVKCFGLALFSGSWLDFAFWTEQENWSVKRAGCLQNTNLMIPSVVWASFVCTDIASDTILLPWNSKILLSSKNVEFESFLELCQSLYEEDRQTTLPEERKKRSLVLLLCWTGSAEVLANKLKWALRALIPLESSLSLSSLLEVDWSFELSYFFRILCPKIIAGMLGIWSGGF